MIKKIIDRYVGGESITKIAKELNLSRWFVWKCIKDNKVKSRSRGLPSGEKNPKRIFTDKQEIQICKQYVSGKTLKECAVKYGSNIALISKILKRHDYKARTNKETGKIGKYCSRYIGSVYYNKKGYRCLYLPDYKWSHKGGWIQEHRYVMQNHLERKLDRSEHVHHINGIKDDNRIENLEIMSASEHSKFHNKNSHKGDL